MLSKVLVFTGRANPHLAAKICGYMKVRPGKAMVTEFADGECRVQIEENVRGEDCFIVQPTSPPVNDNLMELLIMIDALARASAGRITVVMPYYGYCRQDKKDKPRVPISARLVADLITAAGADRILTMDLHAPQVQGFFKIPVDNLFATPVLLGFFWKKKIKHLAVVSPDPGGVERARAFAKKMNSSLVIVDKRREKPNQASVMNIIGKVKDKNIIILDDLVDTSGTLIKVVNALKEKGAKDIYAACSHGVLSANAVPLINESSLEQLVITDSIDIKDRKKSKKIVVLSIAKLMGEAIVRIHEGTSVNSLFV